MSLLSAPSVPPPLPAQRASRRRSLRRAVQVECNVLSDLWDGQAPFLATNLSPEGLWLQTPLPMERGEELLLTLEPPRWSEAQPLVALAQVARVGMYRRRNEPRGAGMGLCFVDVDAAQLAALEHCLRGLPPPLPSMSRAARVLAESVASAPVVTDEETWLTLDDGLVLRLSAEAELMTSARSSHVQSVWQVPLALAPAPVEAQSTPSTPKRSRRRHRRARPSTRVTLRRPRLFVVPNDLAS